MSVEIGLVGLPNVGKSTLFNALTHAHAAVAPYPFTTIDPNQGVAAVPDPRLIALAEIVKPERVTPASVRFTDIAGLVKNAHRGEGLGNQFLGHIREMDALALVARCFQSPDVPHVHGTLDPVDDLEVLDLELVLADLATLERRLEKTRSAAKANPKEHRAELEALEGLRGHLQAGELASAWAARNPENAALAQDLRLLTAKRRLYVANVGEEDLPAGGACAGQVCQVAQASAAPCVVVAAQLEADLAEWTPEEAAAYRADVGLERSGLENVVWAAYRTLNLLTFFTVAGGKEVRAWALQRGSTAPEAAGKVHSDMERGFIRAEVTRVDALVAAGSWQALREAGALRSEGRDYVVQDGDVCLFRFNV